MTNFVRNQAFRLKFASFCFYIALGLGFNFGHLQAQNFENLKVNPRGRISVSSGSGILYYTPSTTLLTGYQSHVWQKPNPLSRSEYVNNASSSRKFASHIRAYQPGLAELQLLAPNLANDRPTTAADIRNYLMDEAQINSLNNQFQYALTRFNSRNEFYATTRGSVSPIRPALMSEEDEYAARHNMASALKRYMLWDGIPNFLLSREDTGGLGESYTNAVQAMNDNTNLKIQSKEKTWSVAAGINPLNFVGYATYKDPELYMSLVSNVKTLSTSIDMRHTVDPNRKVSLGTYYSPNSHVVGPGVYWIPESTLSTYFGFYIPYRAEDLKNAVSTTASLSLSF